MVEFGVGFVTGRKNVCNIINNYYKLIQEQLGREANLTFFLLYDLNYNNTQKEDFYQIHPEVYQSGVKIKYIEEEAIQKEKKRVQEKYHLTQEEADAFLGSGYARARNTVMYWAKEAKMDYLLFWDDDEYPVACLQEGKEIIWKEQNTIAEHMKYIANADVTIGHHCGYISPIPYIDFDHCISEKDFKNYIDSVSNEAVYWEKLKQIIKQNGITYAQKEITEAKDAILLNNIGKDSWLSGSTLCLNMNRIENIPAFYNPPKARGEDTFFSTMIKDAKVYRIPAYHFHDGFLKYTQIMKKDYPTELLKVKLEDERIEKRFFDVSMGWIKYKPLLLYIMNKQEYREKINQTYEQLEACIPKMSKIFVHHDMRDLLRELKEYDAKVEEHYQDYVRTNEIWNKIKLG